MIPAQLFDDVIAARLILTVVLKPGDVEDGVFDPSGMSTRLMSFTTEPRVVLLCCAC